MRLLKKKIPVFEKKKTFPKYICVEEFNRSKVEKVLRHIRIKSMYAERARKGINVGLCLDNEDATIIEYKFRYNKDRLLLLRSVATGPIDKKEKFLDDKKSLNIVSPRSILDFAISARPSEGDYKPVWVPVHGKVKNVSLNPTIKVFIDTSVQVDSPLGMLKENFSSIRQFKIVQSFVAVNPLSPEKVMWRHSISHDISVDRPYCEIENKIEIMRDIHIERMYLTMLSAVSKNMTNLILNNGIKYNSIPQNGIKLELDRKINSAMYYGRSLENGFIACAVDVVNPQKEMDTRVTFREDNVTKFYLNTFTGIAKKDDVFQNAQRIICISGVASEKELLRSEYQEHLT